MGNFEDISDRLVCAVAAGSTLTDACEALGVNVHTARNWLTDGRRNPDGRYGGFARALDEARADAAVDGDDALELGPVESQVEALIAGRELDDEGLVVAAQARSLARTVDVLGVTSGGSAGQAIANVSRRLQELVDRLYLQPRDAITELQGRREHRLALMQGTARR